MKDEHALMFLVGIFAAMGVALVLYQHASATAQINAALGVPTPSASGGQGLTLMLGSSVSLAGTPTIGQTGSAQAPAVIPTQINPGGYLQ